MRRPVGPDTGNPEVTKSRDAVEMIRVLRMARRTLVYHAAQAVTHPAADAKEAALRLSLRRAHVGDRQPAS